MSLVVKMLGAEAVSTAGTKDLYAVPATASGAIVKNVRVVNTGTTSLTVNLYFLPSGGSQVRILDLDKSIAPGALVAVTDESTMGPSDKIQLVTAGTVSYHFVVSGVERQ